VRLVGWWLFSLLLLNVSPSFAQSFTHGLSMHGDLKYPASFKNFAYVNPDAPKRGELVQANLGTYDSLNPFIVRGVPAAGVGLLFDTLMVQSQDEPFSAYGLLAEAVRTDAARTFVEFRLRAEAKFHDGSPVRVEDVLWTFKTLRDQGRPSYRSYYANVEKASKVDERTVRFDFKPGVNRELPLILGQMPVLSEAFYQVAGFDKVSLETPLGSGPYRVVGLQPGRSITLERAEDYWGKDLPVNKGLYNFAKIRFDYYRDSSVVLEAFKAGQYDFRIENIAKNWATAYDIPAVKSGKIIKEEIKHSNVVGMQGFFFNLRKPLFSDIKVREALNLAFDFETANRTLFYGIYTRSHSYFNNSELAVKGIPEGEELKLLEPFRDQLPRDLFSQSFRLPESKSASQLRLNLKRAADLLSAAGWTVKDGALKNAKDEPFAFEILVEDPTFERVTAPFIQNLERLGIKATVRTIDAVQYQGRMDKYEFDMIIGTFGQSISPGNEQRSYWTSKEADVVGGNNILGVKNPVVDALVEKIVAAPDRKSLVTAVHALDRVLLWNHYVIPHWHTSGWRVVYWDKFGKPTTRPEYGMGFPDTWWMK